MPNLLFSPAISLAYLSILDQWAKIPITDDKNDDVQPTRVFPQIFLHGAIEDLSESMQQQKLPMLV